MGVGPLPGGSRADKSGSSELTLQSRVDCRHFFHRAIQTNISDKMVRFSEKKFGGQVPAQFTAKGTLNGDGLKGELLRPRWEQPGDSLCR